MSLYNSDSMVVSILEFLKVNDIDAASDMVKKGVLHFPTDNRFYILSATIAQANNYYMDAFENLWLALITEPRSQLARNELLHLLVSNYSNELGTDKDFSLDSGERQTGISLEQIRFDHRVRYMFASYWIRRRFGMEIRNKVGLDIFCGNGYGSRMVADMTGARMVGLDGSAESIDLAENVYGSHRVVFGHALYPFEFNSDFFDFAISFESIEHVDDPKGLLEQIVVASKGPLAISFPDESGLPFDMFGHYFKHHVRHFRREEIVSLLSSLGKSNIVAERGQNVYKIEGGEITGLLQEKDMVLCSHANNIQFRVMIVE
ncbi:class I SAM-dependent methyltransferase [Pectobacterium sp. LFLA-215]|uniref:class I SAM-dependent methyltransferase n=1 Tax=Pectobacterium sp. LFLA-215 TaxID=3419008 RepID=UPI003F5CA847